MNGNSSHTKLNNNLVNLNVGLLNIVHDFYKKIWVVTEHWSPEILVVKLFDTLQIV